MGRQITTSKFSFEQLIMNDWLYVDKTEYVWKLVNNHASTFFFVHVPAGSVNLFSFQLWNLYSKEERNCSVIFT